MIHSQTRSDLVLLTLDSPVPLAVINSYWMEVLSLNINLNSLQKSYFIISKDLSCGPLAKFCRQKKVHCQ